VSVWRGHKRVPRGFEFKIPVGELSQPPLAALETIPESARYASQTRDTFHVVRRGESLSIIARRYGVRMSDIQHLNGLRSKHRIRAGQKLRLPTDHKGSRTSTSASTSAPVERSTPPADGLYTVRRGDSIYKIAKRFGMSERDLIAANDLRNRHRIYAGQVLRVSTAVDKAYTGAGHPSTAVVATGSPRAQKTAASTSAQPDPHPQAMAILTPARSAEPSPVPRDPETVLSDNMVDVEVSTFVSVAAEEPEAEPLPLKLIADPSDYSVASDGTVEIQATETLGHVAEWLGVRASRLRAINHLKYGEPLAVNSDLRLDFSQTTPEEFERRRLEYHRGIQEEFFEEWEISGTETHRMRRGDSLWVLSHRRFNVPLWLLRQYNPDIDFEAPAAGSQITVPLLRRRELDAGAQAIAGGELAAG
jgi:membrane-bound lytic murein transglycosylase D